MPKQKKNSLETTSKAKLRPREKGFSLRSSKIGLKDKLNIIAAVENGQTKVDIGREFGIHASTVTSIYRKRDALFKTCINEVGEEVKADVGQRLLNWYILAVNRNHPVSMLDFQEKAKQIADSNKKGFKFTSEWFRSFRMRHKIVKQKRDVPDSPNKLECSFWSNIIDGFDESDVYVGGTCSLLYTDDLQTFISNNLNFQSCVTALLLTNLTGSNKYDLVVAGNALPQNGVRSLPLQYYHKENAKFDNYIVSSILRKWDGELKQADRKVLLALAIPDLYVDRLHLDQIKILTCFNISYTKKTVQRLVNCFKYHYRKLQIMQSFSYGKSESDFLDSLHTMSLAWHNVSSITIHNIFHPRFRNCYYFNYLKAHNKENEENDTFSLSEWCWAYAVPLKLEEDILDNFSSCDNDIASLDSYLEQPCSVDLNEWLSQTAPSPALSSAEALLAARRLLRHAHAISAAEQTISSLNLLEDQLEAEARAELLLNIEPDSVTDQENEQTL